MNHYQLLKLNPVPYATVRCLTNRLFSVTLNKKRRSFTVNTNYQDEPIRVLCTTDEHKKLSIFQGLFFTYFCLLRVNLCSFFRTNRIRSGKKIVFQISAVVFFFLLLHMYTMIFAPWPQILLSKNYQHKGNILLWLSLPLGVIMRFNSVLTCPISGQIYLIIICFGMKFTEFYVRKTNEC